MKKLASLIGAGALLLATTGTAFGFFGDGTVVINKGWAHQDTSADADANTGAQKGGDIELSGGLVITGDAAAVALASAVANQFTTTVVTDCGCDVFVLNRGGAWQDTDADADANTGAQKGGDIEVGGLEIDGLNDWEGEGFGAVITGNATAGSVAESWANIFTTTIVTIGGEE